MSAGLRTWRSASSAVSFDMLDRSGHDEQRAHAWSARDAAFPRGQDPDQRDGAAA